MVRQILCTVLQQQTLDDEALQTVLCEAEAILNDRPISKLSNDPNYLEALTPNHLLLMKGNPVLPPGLFERSDLYAKGDGAECNILRISSGKGGYMNTLVARATEMEQRT